MPDKNLREEFKSVFQKAYGRQLTDAEVEEIIINLSGFFKLLSDYNKKDIEEQQKLQKNGGDTSVQQT